MIIYLDTSIALDAVFDTPDRPALISWLCNNEHTFISSRLLRTEIIRALRCESRPIVEADWLLARVGLLDITRGTHARAEAIDEHVRSLDAIHLATALGLPIMPVIAARDGGLCRVARGLGFTVIESDVKR